MRCQCTASTPPAPTPNPSSHRDTHRQEANPLPQSITSSESNRLAHLKVQLQFLRGALIVNIADIDRASIGFLFGSLLLSRFPCSCTFLRFCLWWSLKQHLLRDILETAYLSIRQALSLALSDTCSCPQSTSFETSSAFFFFEILQ